MTTRRRVSPHRLLGALAGTALLAWPSTGCGLVGGNSVLLLGDSLTVLVADEVKAAIGSDGVTVDAEWGVRIDEELDRATQAASEHPDVVVINLGTNNVLQRYDTTSTTADLASALDLFDGACVHVVNMNEQMNRVGQDFSSEAKALNAQLRTLAARRLNTHIIDWNRIVATHADDGIISDDGVHPTDAGVKLLTDAYVTAIDSC